MAALIFKLRFLDRPDSDGVLDDSFANDLTELQELGATEHIAGPITQVDGTVVQLALFAIPAMLAGELDIHTATYLTTEVMAVRWYNGSFDDLRTDKLRAAWDASRE